MGTIRISRAESSNDHRHNTITVIDCLAVLFHEDIKKKKKKKMIKKKINKQMLRVGVEKKWLLRALSLHVVCEVQKKKNIKI